MQKALSSTGFSGKIMKKDSVFLTLNNITKDIGYTGIGDRPYKRKMFLLKGLLETVAEIQSRNLCEGESIYL